MNSPRHGERLRELHIDRALVGLDLSSREELANLERESSQAPDDYELAAASIWLAFNDEHEPMPASLRAGLERTALEHLGPPRSDRP